MGLYNSTLEVISSFIKLGFVHGQIINFGLQERTSNCWHRYLNPQKDDGHAISCHYATILFYTGLQDRATSSAMLPINSGHQEIVDAVVRTPKKKFE